MRDNEQMLLKWNRAMNANSREVQGESTYLLTCAFKKLKSACASTQLGQNLRTPHEKNLHPWLSKLRQVKILIRLRECAGWSESSLGAHFGSRDFWHCTSSDVDIACSEQHFRLTSLCKLYHYENTSIQIHRKFHLQKLKPFRQKKQTDSFHVSAQSIECGYLLEPPRWGGSNEYPQSMFLSRNKKNNV